MAAQVACELEMWGEAFRSVEDIQSLIMLSKRTPNHKFMATYYARLTQIFAGEQGSMQRTGSRCNSRAIQGSSQVQIAGQVPGARMMLTLSCFPWF
jgi:hypothetical protein